MARKEHHVVSNPQGGWDVKKNNSTRASVHANTKAEAIDAGRKISQNARSEFIIHGLDGRIQRSDSHGLDPNPPKDAK
jgi:Uncharacterized protein conserved in bacteria (DUF2188)